MSLIQLPNGRYTLQEARGIEKDQTYALYNLTQEQLARTLMPVGEYSKPEIRKIAEDHRLMVAHKPDSQDICFVPDGDYAGYLENEAGLKAVPGDFVDIHGNAIGRHKGIIHYTIWSLSHPLRLLRSGHLSQRGMHPLPDQWKHPPVP